MIILRQTVSMFVDAYRELAAGKIFWIAMFLSLVVVAVFAAVGINEDGLTILWFPLNFLGGAINSNVIPPDLLYKQLFTQLGVGVWLTWAATILGIVTTAGIVPTFVSGGSIESHLSKPIGRVRLFLTKYATGLTFMATQVAVFTLSAFFVIGIRGGAWEPRLFIAIPVVVAFYSFLYCMTAFFGLVTRSTITAMLVTFLAWFGIFIVNTVESSLLGFVANAEIRLENTEVRVENLERSAKKRLERMIEEGEDLPPKEEWPDGTEDELEVVSPLLATQRRTRDESAESLEAVQKWHRRTLLVRTILPKTQETIGLLDRSLLSEEDYDRLLDSSDNDRPFMYQGGESEESAPTVGEVQRRISEKILDRSTAGILLSSLAFEFIVLLVSCVIFARRDF